MDFASRIAKEMAHKNSGDVFDQLDDDHDGGVSLDEFKRLDFFPSAEEQKDSTGEGEKWGAAHREKMHGNATVDVIFKSIDKDGSGELDEAELKSYILRSG